MARKAAQERALKKSKRQKKVLMVLALPMLAALYYSYSTLTHLGTKPQLGATPAAATTDPGAIPTADTSAAPAPVMPGITAAPVGSLTSFAVLGVKDPFHDHGPNASGTPSSGGGGKGAGKGGGKGGGKGKGGGGGSKSKQPPPPPLTGAVISINGNKLALSLGTQFGHAPGLSGVSLFRLEKVTAKTALIAVVGTEQQFTLHVGQPLTLQQNGGWKYTLILEPLGSAAPMTIQPTTTKTGP